MKYVFFGTPKFSSIILEKLIAIGYIPEAVICNPDKPLGRKQVFTSPPVKFVAEKFKIKVIQPQKLRGNSEFLEQFKKLKPELAIIVAYGKIITKEVLDIPARGFINVHPSLLPKYRGASPIQYAILNGDQETGITIMEVDEEMDHGKIILNLKVKISNLDTYESLSHKLAESAGELLVKIIPDYISGKIKPVEQEHEKATLTKIIKKEDGRIDWSKSADEIERMIRAYYPWPTAWTQVNLPPTPRLRRAGKSPARNATHSVTGGKISNLKIIEADVLEINNNDNFGEVFLTQNNKLAIKCGKNALIIKKLQLEGRKILSAKEFLNGHQNFIGNILE